MTNVFINFLTGHVYGHVIIIMICTLALVVSMFIDLIMGVRKANENGEATTSQGLKKTADKARKYFSPYIVLICIDFIGSAVLPFPFFAMLWASYCVYCEFVSVREKAWKKAELRRAENTVNVVLENKDDIAKILQEIIFKSNTNEAQNE